MTTPADLLALLIDRAPALRAAGVLSVAVEGISATLAPVEPEPQPEAIADEGDEPSSDPLQDPASYGLKPGQKVPGFTRDEPKRTDRSE